MDDTKISICIPAYKAREYIKETLNSVKNQTYQNWEIVIVEDGKPDGTKEVVDWFETQVQQRIIYINHEINLGVSATRNTAVNHSTGKWIAFLDSDDLWEPDHLADLLNTSLESPDSGLIHSEVLVFDSETNATLSSNPLSQEVINLLPISLYDGRYPTQPSSAMILSDVYRRIGGFATGLGVEGCEDKELWFKFARAGYKFAFTGKATSLYRKHPTALSSQSVAMATAMARVYSLHFDWEAIPKNIRVHHTSDAWFSAAKLIRSDNNTLAKEYLSKSFQYQKTVIQFCFWFLLRIQI